MGVTIGVDYAYRHLVRDEFEQCYIRKNRNLIFNFGVLMKRVGVVYPTLFYSDIITSMHYRKFFLIIGFWICISSDIYSQELSPLLPDTGQLAVVQKKIDLRGGLVVLSIAIAPGFEDMPTLAYFRLKKGAEIGCVYITNGEDFPDYEFGKNAYETAKQRKEEAYQAMSLLNGEAFFLNVPAFICLSIEDDTAEIREYFLKLDKVISEMKPDVILLNSDYIFSKGKIKTIAGDREKC